MTCPIFPLRTWHWIRRTREIAMYDRRGGQTPLWPYRCPVGVGVFPFICAELLNLRIREYFQFYWSFCSEEERPSIPVGRLNIGPPHRTKWPYFTLFERASEEDHSPDVSFTARMGGGVFPILPPFVSRYARRIRCAINYRLHGYLPYSRNNAG